MEKTWTKALKASISDVFSTMFFMVPEEDPGLCQEMAGEDAQGWLEGRVELVREEGGGLAIWCWAHSGLARELAANILSLEPDELSESDIVDAYAEMLNMVAGSLLTAVDQKAQWRLGLPQATVSQGGRLGARTTRAAELLCFDLEGKPLIVGAAPAAG